MQTQFSLYIIYVLYYLTIVNFDRYLPAYRTFPTYIQGKNLLVIKTYSHLKGFSQEWFHGFQISFE